MFPRPRSARRTPPASPGRGRGAALRALDSRVRGLGEVFGELPVACLAEEIETPGEGQVRALITIAGNPAVEHAERRAAGRGARALDFMVSVDIYVNETTRHADVILPGALAAASARTTTSRSTGSRCATSPTTRRRCSTPDPDVPRRVGDAAAPDRRSSPARARTPTSPRIDALRRARDRAPRRAPTPHSPRPRPRPRGAARRGRRRASGPSGCSTSCCARGPVRR